jgi:hypothetical protein
MMNCVKRILILLLFILIIPKYSTSQDTVVESVSPHTYKNAVKGMPLLLPFVGVAFYAGLSVGYERYISKQHCLELCGYYYFNVDEMGAQFHKFSIMPGYKYFFVSGNKMLNNSWAGVYLSYYQDYQTVSDGDGGSNRQYYYGIGLSIGKKINLSHNKRWFLDLGIGVSFNKFLDEPVFSDTKWEDKFINNSFLPRPILQIGRKF